MKKLAMLLWLAACGSGSITDVGLSKSCSVDADCAPVYVGQACGTCTCPNAAIAAKELSRYEAEANAARQWCGPRPAIACDCIRFTVTCASGTCLGTNQ